jgi:hypothetical protein
MNICDHSRSLEIVIILFQEQLSSFLVEGRLGVGHDEEAFYRLGGEHKFSEVVIAKRNQLTNKIC